MCPCPGHECSSRNQQDNSHNKCPGQVDDGRQIQPFVGEQRGEIEEGQEQQEKERHKGRIKPARFAVAPCSAEDEIGDTFKDAHHASLPAPARLNLNEVIDILLFINSGYEPGDSALIFEVFPPEF